LSPRRFTIRVAPTAFNEAKLCNRCPLEARETAEHHAAEKHRLPEDAAARTQFRFVEIQEATKRHIAIARLRQTLPLLWEEPVGIFPPKHLPLRAVLGKQRVEGQSASL